MNICLVWISNAVMSAIADAFGARIIQLVNEIYILSVWQSAISTF